MAFLRVETNDQFIGASSDVKPNATEGATLHIIDTGEEYIFHDGMWMQDLRRIYALQQVS